MKQWFRPPSRHRFGAARRPSGDEMREELESHVAMRAEHDGVDQAAARRRLGNTRTRALQSQLYNVPALDPWSWAAALVSLALVLLTAVLRPARHAAHVDPIAALRAE